MARRVIHPHVSMRYYYRAEESLRRQFSQLSLLLIERLMSDVVIVEDCYRKEIEYKGKKMMLEVIDTAGTEQFTTLVELYIKNCQVESLMFHAR